MKAVLTALKEELEGEDLRVELVPDRDALPRSRRFPLVALAGGSIDAVQDGLNETTTRLTAYVIVYYGEALEGDDRGIVGGTSEDGIEAFAAAVDGVLRGNDLGLTDVEDAWPEPSQASEVWGTERLALVRKVMAYTYTRVDT